MVYDSSKTEDVKPLYTEKNGVVYILTCDIGDGIEHILKPGQTGLTMEKRQKSYDCGDTKNRDNGTCSTTNFKVKQSMAGGLIFNVYVLDCSQENKKWSLCGKESSEITSGKSIAYEEIIQGEFFEEFKQKPLLCTQIKK